MRKAILLILLFCFSNSVAHAYIMDDYQNETVHEFVAEFSINTHQGDLCDLHYEFHIPFILQETSWNVEIHLSTSVIEHAKELSPNELHLKLVKPPATV